MKTRDDIYAEINKERSRQDLLTGQECDDKRTKYEWLMFINQKCVCRWKRDEITFRQCLIKIAALCVAALESDIRKEELTNEIN